MALNKILRPGLVQMRVLKMEESLPFYRDILGLDVVTTLEDGRVCLKTYDEFDHHSVVLREADTAGVDFVAFKADSAETLEKVKEDTEAFGYPVTEIPAESDQPGFGKRYSFTICTGHRFDVYSEVELAADMPMVKNPDIWRREPRGMAAKRMDHFLLYGPGVAEAERFCKEVFGMYTPEICNSEDGARVATWLTSSNKPHDLAFVEYPDPGRIHHLGFELEDWSAVGHAADLMAVNDLKRDVGPTRHAITRGQTIYLWEPSGNRIELYAGGYTAYPDNPLRVWDFAELGKGLFYYEREMYSSFLKIVT